MADLEHICADEIHWKVLKPKPTDAERISKLEEVNRELVEACLAAFVYLDKPYQSGMGNVEIINLLQAALSKSKGG